MQPVLRHLLLGDALEPQDRNAGDGQEVDVVRPVADGRLDPGPEHSSPEARELKRIGAIDRDGVEAADPVHATMLSPYRERARGVD